MNKEYPNLERYLKNAARTETIRSIFRLDQVITWVGIIVMIVLFNTSFWLMLTVIPVLWALQWIANGLRLKNFSLRAQLADAAERRMPAIMLKGLQRNDLVTLIGAQAIASLEQSAKSASGPAIEFVQAKMLGMGNSKAYLQAQRDAMMASDKLMRLAIGTLRRTLIYRVEMRAGEMNRLGEYQQSLERIAAESEAAAELVRNEQQPALLEESLVKLRAFREVYESASEEHDKLTER